MLARIAFYLLWPLVWVYAPLRLRVSVAVLVDDAVLLVKSDFGSGKWQLPGGGMKFGESVLDAGRRELTEELGVSLPPTQCIVLFESFLVTRFAGLLQRECFIGCRLESKPAVVANHEISDYCWMKVSDARLPNRVKDKLAGM